MKNLITATACIMILLVFLLQFSSNQVLHSNLTKVEKNIETFQQVVRKDGCVNQTNIVATKKAMADTLNCTLDKITIVGDRVPQTKGNIINYTIKFPIENLIAAEKFWNLAPDENSKYYILDQTTISEYVDRSRNW